MLMEGVRLSANNNSNANICVPDCSCLSMGDWIK